MTSKMYLGKTGGTIDEHENDRRDESSFYRNYRNLANTKTKYSNNNETSQPYSINHLQLQNSYKSTQSPEGYAPTNPSLKIRSRFYPKGYQRSRDMNFRSKNNNRTMTRREISTINVENFENNKIARSHLRRRDIRLYLKKIELAETAKQYCSNSTLHGLRYIGDPSLTIVEKMFWLLSIFVAVVYATHFIRHLYQKWIDTPIIISIDPEPVGFNDFPFPSVTVCNMNRVKKTEAIRIRNGKDKRRNYLVDARCRIYSTTNYDSTIDPTRWDDALQFMVNVTQPCTDMLRSCKWHGNFTDCEKLFYSSMTDDGICCNFNSVNKKHLFQNPSESTNLNITSAYNSLDWNPEEGFPASTPPDVIPWRPNGAGMNLGLTLVIDSELEEYYCSSTASVGFKMFLHSSVESPKITNYAFALSPGRETRIIIKPQITTAKHSIIRVPKNKRKCFFVSERTLRYYRTYTQTNCLLECEANFTQELCNCVQLYMPKASTTRVCRTDDITCVRSAMRVMEQNLYDEERKIDQINITKIPICNCWPGCFEINYEYRMSSTKLTNIKNSAIYVEGVSREYFTENMAVVHLFFVDSQFPKYVKSELFGFSEFLSSTGGLLGLFMGFSFLSVAEIVYFVTLRVWCRIRTRRGTSDKSSINVLPAKNDKNFVYPFAQ